MAKKIVEDLEEIGVNTLLSFLEIALQKLQTARLHVETPATAAAAVAVSEATDAVAKAIEVHKAG